MRIGQALSVLFLLGTSLTHAQAVRKKQLLMSVGGGIGVMNLFSDREDIAVDGLGSGALRAAFGYAVSDGWSVGIHYDRIGSTWHNGAIDRLHMTTYMLSFAHRPWMSQDAAVEFEFAFGLTAASLFPLESRLPYTAAGSAVSLGLRYLGMLSNTIGAFAALDHAASSSNQLTLEGGVVNPNGILTKIQWNSPRVTAGVLVRF